MNVNRMENQLGANPGPFSSNAIVPQLIPSPLSAPAEGTQCNPQDSQHPTRCYESIGGAAHAYRGPLAWGIGQCGGKGEKQDKVNRARSAANEEQERAAKEAAERAAKEAAEYALPENVAKRMKDHLMLTLRRLVILFCVD